MDRIDVMEALFGSEEFFEIQGEDEMGMRRRPNGIWYGPEGAQNTRVSGVLVASVVPVNIPTAPICLYHNPFAERPCTGLPWRLPQGIPGDTKMEWTEGVGLGELLGLRATWPRESFEE